MVADVQMWVDQPETNFGWLVIGNESERSTAKRFASKDNSTTADHPTLTIVYMPSEQIFLPIIIKN